MNRPVVLGLSQCSMTSVFGFSLHTPPRAELQLTRRAVAVKVEEGARVGIGQLTDRVGTSE
jgi:hypothetical protein